MRTNEAAWIESRARWQIKVQQDGVRRTFVSSTPGKKGKIEAEKKADKWLATHIRNENSRVSDLLDDYINHLKQTTSKANWRPCESHVNVWIKPVIGTKRIKSLTEHDLDTVIARAYAKGLAHKTLSNICSCMMAFLKYCRRRKVSTLCPEEITIPTGAKRSEKHVLPPVDIKAVFSSTETIYRGKEQDDILAYAYRLMIVAGLRPGELIGLRWSDVVGDRIAIMQSINDENDITQGKNQNARRAIVLSALGKQIIDAQADMLKKRGMISPYVFPYYDGEYVPQEILRATWYRFCEYHGITRITPYELRHTFVSVNKEMPEGLKKMVVGHSRDFDTEAHYGHEMQGDLARAAEYIDTAFDQIIAGE